MFAETGKIETGNFMQEMPRDLMALLNGDPEQKGVTQAYKMSGQAKLKGIKDFLENIIANQETKFILFAHHQDVLDSLEKFITKKMGTDSLIRIDGNTDAQVR